MTLDIEEKVDIKITLSGERACGKTVMAVFLKRMLESLGAEVILTGFDFEKHGSQQYIKHVETMPKRFDKSRITIFEEMANTNKESFTVGIKNLKLLSMDKKTKAEKNDKR